MGNWLKKSKYYRLSIITNSQRNWKTCLSSIEAIEESFTNKNALIVFLQIVWHMITNSSWFSVACVSPFSAGSLTIILEATTINRSGSFQSLLPPTEYNHAFTRRKLSSKEISASLLVLRKLVHVWTNLRHTQYVRKYMFISYNMAKIYKM